ncbi:hypothetical protein PoB_000530200, partial [Plakobranchus ocellatus]
PPRLRVATGRDRSKHLSSALAALVRPSGQLEMSRSGQRPVRPSGKGDKSK